jgi:uncharacterized protein YdeI (YjbR/CyaY-like superfamily)
MMKKPTDVQEYLKHGCGRCPLGDTPECKVHRWQEELGLLREIMLKSDLLEEIKWSVPCYTFEGKNIAIVAAFKEYCSLSFFKGAGLIDPDGILEKAGENSPPSRLVRFTSIGQIKKQRASLVALLLAAIDLERFGYKAPSVHPSQMDWPDELLDAFEQDSRLREAFGALTPGRQRGYLLFFAAAKQSKTRIDRIEKNRQRILSGLGMHD